MQNAAKNASDYAQENKAAFDADIHKNQAQNPNLPLADRAKAAGQYVGDKASEGVHSLKQDVRDVKDAKPGLSHETLEKQAAVKAEVHKSQARDSNLPVTDRAKAAGQYVGDKASEGAHYMQKETTPREHEIKEKEAGMKAEVHKFQAKNPDLPLSDRAKAAGQYVGDKASEGAHYVQKEPATATEHAIKEKEAGMQAEVHKFQAKNPDLPLADRARAAGQYVGDKASEGVHAVQSDVKSTPDNPTHAFLEADAALRAEAHKYQAQDPSLPYTERIKAGTQFIGDKIAETYHSATK